MAGIKHLKYLLAINTDAGTPLIRMDFQQGQPIWIMHEIMGEI
jgi:hypothetical protein